MKILHLAFIVVLLYCANRAHAQNNAAKIIEAKMALDANDCKVAMQALHEVNNSGRADPLWTFYIAKTFDCMKVYDSAIYYYDQYAVMVPDDDGKIATLSAAASYNLRKQNENKRQDRLDDIRREQNRKWQIDEQKRLSDIENKEKDFGSIENAINYLNTIASKYPFNNSKVTFEMRGCHLIEKAHVSSGLYLSDIDLTNARTRVKNEPRSGAQSRSFILYCKDNCVFSGFDEKGREKKMRKREWLFGTQNTMSLYIDTDDDYFNDDTVIKKLTYAIEYLKKNCSVKK